MGPRNDRSGADIDMLGPRNAFFGFDGAPEAFFESVPGNCTYVAH